MTYQISFNLRREPQARNEIYQKRIAVGCPYCKRDGTKGRAKNYNTLFCLYMHFRTHHEFEPNFREVTMQVADLIISGVLL